MASSGSVGSVHVDLGLNSAQFAKGLKKAQAGLADFGKAAAIGLAAVATAAVAAGAALGIAVKGAIDHADELGKTAQKIGVSVEALSRLEYAAKLSDVSLDGLATGLRKLSQNMTTAASGAKGGVAEAFKALGISVKSADGSLRASDEVLADVADRFSRMENGALKTSLAVQIFGKSGADLIPLLNEGRDGLKEYADEADRLGITLTQKTTKGAEAFNDTLTKIGAVMEGVVNKVMEAALPALNAFAETLASPEFAEAAQSLALGVIGALDRIIQAVVDTINYFADLAKAARMEEVKENLRKTLSGERPRGDPARRTHSTASVYAGMLGTDGRINMLGTPQGAPKPDKPANPFEPIIPSIQKARKEIEITIPRISEMEQGFRAIGAAVEDTVASGLSGLVKDAIRGQDAIGGLIDKVANLGDQLIDMAFNQAIQGLFSSIMGVFSGGSGLGSGAIGRGVYGGNTGFFPGFPGFANGGSGVVGGIGSPDSKLFVAKVSPGEPFAFGDDAVEGMGRGGMMINIPIDARGATRDAGPGIAEAVRKVLPDALAQYNRNPYRRK